MIRAQPEQYACEARGVVMHRALTRRAGPND